MRLKSFIWFAAVVLLLLLILAVAQTHGGSSMADWLPKIHGHYDRHIPPTPRENGTLAGSVSTPRGDMDFTAERAK